MFGLEKYANALLDCFKIYIELETMKFQNHIVETGNGYIYGHACFMSLADRVSKIQEEFNDS